jgi:hypothetical protein
LELHISVDGIALSYSALDRPGDEKSWLFEPLAHNLMREPGEEKFFYFFPPQPIEKSRFGKENENK